MAHECPPEPPFELPAFEHLYLVVLRDVSDRRLDPPARKAAARALAFLLREHPCERVVTDILVALHCSLDVSPVVKTLLVGLRDALGDHERIAEWTTKVAGRAHAGRRVESFISSMRVLVVLRDFDGGLPTSWQLSLLRASEDPRLQRRLLLLSDDYARRFGSEARWVTTVRARYLLGANRHAEPTVTEES